jgi:hypothetical protein
VKLTEVCDFNVLAQAGLELVDEVYVAGSDGAVVHMYCGDCDFIFGLVLLVEDGLVDWAFGELEGIEYAGEFLVPAPARLFEVIEGLPQAQDACSSVTWFVTRGVLHVQHLVVIQLSIQVRSLNVDLVQLKTQAVSHGNNGSGGRESGHRCIGVVVIDTINLTETLCHQASLESGDDACGILLGLEDLLGADDIHSWWWFF